MTGETDKHTPLYTIGVAADLLDVSVPTLRKYEAEHLILPARTDSGHRRYSQQDIEILTCIRSMIDSFGVSISGINRLLALIPCWEIKGCSVSEREHCDAYYNEDLPCWSANVKRGVCLEDECRLCPVYDKANNLSHLKGLFRKYFNE